MPAQPHDLDDLFPLELPDEELEIEHQGTDEPDATHSDSPDDERTDSDFA